ncbi:MAG: tRNA (adenosine(37)-N6)-threonylcarbamoyltransferase complex transferase subunit TsaD [Phycisphaerales bacterium]|nr:tRNA (adenosine(37)-N6)-threonylcarbamoyltransferase complex transferase subunit TsaD [Phycisphaerales bacterium]MCB9862466.1 tRNA (adenosine(37)-N6)-threonylcarbamoyltransferase complex transferase subunit TsaD [Phycisphaerales bacterium]
MTIALGIETSCDETSVAIVESSPNEERLRVHCNLIATQFDLHAKFGGVVPEIASRAHLQKLDLLVREALESTGIAPADLDVVTVTCMPGLIGTLLVGVTAARTLAWSWDKPLLGVNHIHAHATSAAIELDAPPWPAVALVVSGGHTSLYHVRDWDDISLLGATIDDAAGEAFDKVAAILELGYPGGPIVDRRAATGNPAAVAFPRSMLKGESLDFSFSGLKTAVLYEVHGRGNTSGGLVGITEERIADICASFSQAVVDVLVAKTRQAVRSTGARSVVVGGGVAANSVLRRDLTAACSADGIAVHLTPMRYCTDNAAMIASHGIRLFERGHRSDLALGASANVKD